MSIRPTTEIVLRWISKDWQSRGFNIARHLREQFGYNVTCPPHVQRLLICQMADGDVAGDDIGSEAKAKWTLAGTCLESVPVTFLRREMTRTDESHQVFVTPIFRFCFDDQHVLLSELFGHGLGHRRLGTVVRAGDEFTIEWITRWCNDAPTG